MSLWGHQINVKSCRGGSLSFGWQFLDIYSFWQKVVGWLGWAKMRVNVVPIEDKTVSGKHGDVLSPLLHNLSSIQTFGRDWGLKHFILLLRYDQESNITWNSFLWIHSPPQLIYPVKFCVCIPSPFAPFVLLSLGSHNRFKLHTYTKLLVLKTCFLAWTPQIY